MIDYCKEIKQLLLPYICSDLKRYGAAGDGGYILSESLTEQSNIVYSYGVGNNDEGVSFDKSMASHGKKLFLYDASINSFWYNPPQFNFKSEYVNSKNIYKHIQENNHLDDKNMILKMDIEGCEYETLINCEDRVFDHFSQIILELHDVVNECNDANLIGNIRNINDTEARWMNKINLLTRLNKDFYVVHIHGNNWVKTKTEGLCDVLEVTYIKKSKFTDKLELSNTPCPVPGLDFKCCEYDWHNPDDVVLDWWVK
jgi:FkbM family methyltransferase